MLTMAGIGAHLGPEIVLTIDRNPCSPWSGAITMQKRVPELVRHVENLGPRLDALWTDEIGDEPW